MYKCEGRVYAKTIYNNFISVMCEIEEKGGSGNFGVYSYFKN